MLDILKTPFFFGKGKADGYSTCKGVCCETLFLGLYLPFTILPIEVLCLCNLKENMLAQSASRKRVNSYYCYIRVRLLVGSTFKCKQFLNFVGIFV